MGGVLGLLGQITAPGPLAEPHTVLINPGQGVLDIGAELQAEGVVASPWLFALVAGLTGPDHLKAGEYLFEAHLSLEQVVGLMRRGRTVVHRLTVPEGLTSAQVVALLQAEPLLAGEVGPVPAEGTLLPDTYNFSRGDQRSALILRLRTAMAAALSQAWAQRAPHLPFKTPAEAVTLASVVEKETGRPGERPLVAGVFINRLASGMPLQSDPTVIYALTNGAGPLGRPLSRADLQLESPYNTYRIPALPPGPIANPGRAALQAVLHPEAHSYLYFVADGTGGHAFAATLEQHNQNVAAWRAHQAGHDGGQSGVWDGAVGVR